MPAWFVASRVTVDVIEGRAHVAGSAWEESGLELVVRGKPVPIVAERVPGTDLPARCPERHVQGDRTFCVGLDRPAVGGRDDAGLWWEHLRQYVLCQSVAKATGVWPPNHALDHGDAGGHHRNALEIASRLGIEDEYIAAYQDEPSWITDPDLRLLGRKDEPINGREPCPRGCRVRGRPTVPKIRRKCRWRADLLRLVIEERKRRVELVRYWESVRKAGIVCCRTMRSCPLRDGAEG